ncbi:methyltransferase domain-containing protein [Streptomyces melanogenes]|uniref:Protein-L-isoaspartate O-methyltransferase n=1 Tax=Streptomyces melanogenes TaxID=67326 RepID=A0ABZ1XLN4_9ACTN|nr:methyltransferase domain-containing protein [Streptomyces melanogenes]
MNWEHHAQRLADTITDPDSRWHSPVAQTPRHILVPRWWARGDDGRWALREGLTDPAAWWAAAYGDESLVTRVGPLHADHAKPDDHPEGLPTSSATMPSLVVRMLRHGRLHTGLSLLDLGTGAGGLAAYAAQRLGSQQVTSLDVDPYLTEAARDRLADIGLHPQFITADATTDIPGTYDRIIATVAMPPGPGLRPMLAALRPGGRLVTTLARMGVILTAWKDDHGECHGRIGRDSAGFMLTRNGEDYPPALAPAAEKGDPEITTGRYPVLNVTETWELRSMLEIAVPGVQARYEERDGIRTAYLAHPDGSWARASAERLDPPTVHQSGPQRLWDRLERIRNRLNAEGALPLHGAHATISPDGVIHLSRGKWEATLGAQEASP